MDYDKIYKSLPELGIEKYDEQIKKLDNSIPFTLEELFDKVPNELPYNDSQTAKLSIDKIGKQWYSARYSVYKNPYKQDWEKITINYFTGPTVKIALYGAYCWTNKN